MSESDKEWIKEFTLMWEENHHEDNEAETIPASDIERLLSIIRERENEMQFLVSQINIGLAGVQS